MKISEARHQRTIYEESSENMRHQDNTQRKSSDISRRSSMKPSEKQVKMWTTTQAINQAKRTNSETTERSKVNKTLVNVRGRHEDGFVAGSVPHCSVPSNPDIAKTQGILTHFQRNKSNVLALLNQTASSASKTTK